MINCYRIPSPLSLLTTRPPFLALISIAIDCSSPHTADSSSWSRMYLRPPQVFHTLCPSSWTLYLFRYSPLEQPLRYLIMVYVTRAFSGTRGSRTVHIHGGVDGVQRAGLPILDKRRCQEHAVSQRAAVSRADAPTRTPHGSDLPGVHSGVIGATRRECRRQRCDPVHTRRDLQWVESERARACDWKDQSTCDRVRHRDRGDMSTLRCGCARPCVPVCW